MVEPSHPIRGQSGKLTSAFKEAVAQTKNFTLVDF